MKTSLFNIREKTAAKKLGIAPEYLRELRSKHLYQEVDFIEDEREVKYTEDSLNKIYEVIGSKEPAGGAEVGVYLSERKGAGILDAIVKKIYAKNTQCLEAMLGDLPIVVHVRSNANFTVGMIIESRQLVMKNPRVFEFIGKCPRARGRW